MGQFIKIKRGTSSFLPSSSLGWCLFDFANSIPAVIGGIYFAKWFTEDVGASSVLFNILFLCVSIFIALISTKVGRAIDKNGIRVWIKRSFLLVGLSLFLLFGVSRYIGPPYIISLSFALFFVFLSAYQLGRICHNAYLRTIIPEEKQAKLSGLGAMANWAGSLIGILLTLPIISTYLPAEGRTFTFFAAALCYGILTPFSIWLMFRKKAVEQNTQKKFIHQMTARIVVSSVGIYFVIYFLLLEVMATVQRNLPLFLTHVSKLSDKTQGLGFALILLSAMCGGALASRFVRTNNVHYWLMAGIFVLSGAIFLVALNDSFILWWAFVSAGLAYGLLEAAIRIHFMRQFSPASAGMFFGVFSVVERTSGLLGPLIWILPFSLQSSAVKSYQIAMTTMGCMCILAGLLLFYKKEPGVN